jgi:hypothetical protein
MRNVLTLAAIIALSACGESQKPEPVAQATASAPAAEPLSEADKAEINKIRTDWAKLAEEAKGQPGPRQKYAVEIFAGQLETTKDLAAVELYKQDPMLPTALKIKAMNAWSRLSMAKK